jgi:hypothetical protein
MLIQLTTAIQGDGGPYTHAKITKARVDFQADVVDFSGLVGTVVDNNWVAPTVPSISGVMFRFYVRDQNFASLLSFATQTGTLDGQLTKAFLQWAIDHNGPQGTIV